MLHHILSIDVRRQNWVMAQPLCMMKSHFSSVFNRLNTVDIHVNANLESVDRFRYLVDMLSVDGDANAAWRPEFDFDGINTGSWYHCCLHCFNAVGWEAGRASGL